MLTSHLNFPTILNVLISAHHCLLPPDPINGHRNCTEANDAVYCSLSCMDGYAFAMHPSEVIHKFRNFVKSI